MEYTLRFDSATILFLEKLNKETSRQIWKKLMASKDNPHHFFERLVERKEFKLRVGDYRIIADIDDELKLIEIRVIEHRKNIYDKI
jgi:mRNA interferase RelE/StbE